MGNDGMNIIRFWQQLHSTDNNNYDDEDSDEYEDENYCEYCLSKLIWSDVVNSWICPNCDDFDDAS